MAVLVVSGIGLLVAGTTLLLVRADLRGTAYVAESTRSRALAWSGLQAVAVELGMQRDRMIDGERPELESQYVIEEDGPRLGVVRLLPVGPGGELLQSEASKADLAQTTAEQLEASGLIDATLAEAIVASRARVGGRLDSVAGLIGASEGNITVEDLYGDAREFGTRDAVLGIEADRAERILDRLIEPEPRGLADLLTVHAVEPSIDASGRPRIVIAPPWTEEMDAELRERFSDPIADGVKTILDEDRSPLLAQLLEGLSLEADADLATLMARIAEQGGEVGEQWIGVVDRLCFDRSPYRVGRVDINRAPPAVLRMLPTITPEEVEAIVATRDALDGDERRTVLWPVLRGIIPIQRYPELFERITVRSFSWRLRLACGTVDAEAPDGPIENATVWEVVVDASEARPRFSMIRDITQLDLAMAVAAGLAENEADAESPWRSEEASPASEETSADGDAVGAEEVEEPESSPESGTEEEDAPGPTRPRRPRDAADDPEAEGDESSTEPGGTGFGSPQPIGRWRPLR